LRELDFDSWGLVQQALAQRGKGLPDWPKYVFLPSKAWYQILSSALNRPRLDMDTRPDLGTLMALGTWRYTQGIYRFDQVIYQALFDTPLDGNLPSQAFLRLPQWCIYIDTPGLDDMAGFFAFLTADLLDRLTLMLMIDRPSIPDVLEPHPVFLGNWSLDKAQKMFMKAAEKTLDVIVEENAYHDEVARMLSLLLYLCSQEPDIADYRQPGELPANPKAKKVHLKSGGKDWKLFPPSAPTVWHVGDTMGEQLRAAIAAQTAQGERATLRPHIRRAHWHRFWTGPRAGSRSLVHKWIHPLIVGADRLSE
jgi:hypothetical protein